MFEDFHQTGLKNSPERATSYGDYRYNAQLGQYSSRRSPVNMLKADDFLARLKAIPTDGMSDKDLLSHRMLREPTRARGRERDSLKNYEMPVNQQNGVHTRLADLPLSIPLDSVQHYQGCRFLGSH